MATITAYLRVSTDKQTLENQRGEISRFANRNCITVDRWVEEIVSGKVKDSEVIAKDLEGRKLKVGEPTEAQLSKKKKLNHGVRPR